jgi:hypothetical protein
MHDRAGRETNRGDRAGPVLLIFLLAGAFLPSLFIEFDLARLVAELADAMSRSEAPILVLLPSSEAPPVELPAGSGRGELQVSTHIEGYSPARLPRPKDGRLLPSETRAVPLPEWPPGPALSPRAPPDAS